MTTDKTILLGLLPYWTPLIPPLGIAGLKSCLQQHGYRVKTVDFNTRLKFRELYDRYFARLAEALPEDKQGNLYNIGHDLLENHLTAHLLQEEETAYIDLVRLLIRQNFFHDVDIHQAYALSDIARQFFSRLKEDILELLGEVRPGVLGLSVFRGTLAASLYAFRLARIYDPALRTIMGGAVFSQELQEEAPDFDAFLKRTPYIDHCFIGEGEELLLKWLRGEVAPGQKVISPRSVPVPGFELESAPVPDFADFDIQLYPHLAASASRSCPFQCKFCAETLYWRPYRRQSAGRVADQLKSLFRQYGRKLFLMCDSLLNPIVSDLAARLQGAGLYWDGYLRVAVPVCDDQQTLRWREGGFYRARLGIESGSARVLKLMGKKITPRQIRRALQSLAAAGIKTTTYWVIGYPGETEEDFRETLDLIGQMKDDIYEAECNHFRYFPAGQVNSAQWGRQIRHLSLYPEAASGMLMYRTWTLDGRPGRQETFQRVNRFVRHCRKLGIPNPYSLEEIHRADERWARLHKHAVPSLARLEDGGEGEAGPGPGEQRRFKRPARQENVFREDGDFGF